MLNCEESEDEELMATGKHFTVNEVGHFGAGEYIPCNE